jgi:hypothetical protein
MNTAHLTNDQIDTMKDLFADQNVCNIDVSNDLKIVVWLDKDSTDGMFFLPDGSVYRRLGQQGVYNYQDYIVVDDPAPRD